MTIMKHGTVEVAPDGHVTISDFVFAGVDSSAAQAEAVLWAIRRLTGVRPRAAGGPVRPDVTYRVDEHGAEVFVPETDGVVVPDRPLTDAERELRAEGKRVADTIYDDAMARAKGEKEPTE